MAKHDKRAVHGILLLDKPTGLTSNRVLQKVKRLFNARKAGHTGSLDPLASGLLPLCLGEATKVAGYLLDADKTYQVTMRLGSQTTTGDAEGEIKATADIPELNKDLLEKTLLAFEGESEQVPPMFSAIKKDGQPLYKLARKGVEVERKPRKVTFYACQLLSFDETTVSVRVKCSKGTYIRVFTEDFAKALGTVGHVEALRRIAAGPFDEAQLVTLAQLEAQSEKNGAESLDRWLLPMEKALSHWSDVHLTQDMTFFIRRGAAVNVFDRPDSGWVRLFDADKVFLGIGQIQEDGRVAPKRLMNY